MHFIAASAQYTLLEKYIVQISSNFDGASTQSVEDRNDANHSLVLTGSESSVYELAFTTDPDLMVSYVGIKFTTIECSSRKTGRRHASGFRNMRIYRHACLAM